MTAIARNYTVTKGKIQPEACPRGAEFEGGGYLLSLSAAHLKSFTKIEEVEGKTKTAIRPTSKQGEILENPQ